HPAAAMPRASAASDNTANLGIFMLASCLQGRRRPGRYCARLFREKYARHAQRDCARGGLHQGVTVALVGLRRHRPQRDQVRGEHDEDEHSGRASEPVRTAALSQPPSPDACEDDRNKKEQTTRLRRDVADADPAWLVGATRKLLGTNPFGADSHREPRGDRDDQEGPERESREHGGATALVARPAEDLHRARRDKGADENRRPKDVQKQRVVPTVRSNRSEHRQAPGLKIMSTRRRRTVAMPATWNQSARRSCRRARSSGLGALEPSLASASARSRAEL